MCHLRIIKKKAPEDYADSEHTLLISQTIHALDSQITLYILQMTSA